MQRSSFVAAGAFLALAISAQAQWINHPSAGVPRTKDGKPILTAPAVTLTPDTDLLESVCENERDVPHLVGK